MSSQPPDESGPSLGVDGTLHHGPGPSSPGPGPGSVTAPPADAPLELMERPPRPAPAPQSAQSAPVAPAAQPPRARSVWVGVAVGLVLLLVSLGSGFGALRDRRALADGVQPSTRLDELIAATRPGHVLIVNSEPSGATLLIDGREVGVTPFAGDNSSDGTLHLELRLKGYRTQLARAQGGTEARLDVTLVRQ